MFKYSVLMALVSVSSALAAPLECQLESRTLASGVGPIGGSLSQIAYSPDVREGSEGSCFVADAGRHLPQGVWNRLVHQGYALRPIEDASDPNVGAVACFRAGASGQVEVSLQGLWAGDADIQQVASRVLRSDRLGNRAPVLGLVIYPSDFDRAYSQITLSCGN